MERERRLPAAQGEAASRREQACARSKCLHNNFARVFKALVAAGDGPGSGINRRDNGSATYSMALRRTDARGEVAILRATRVR